MSLLSISIRSCNNISPASSSGDINIVVTPVNLLPSIIARWIGDARGIQEAVKHEH